MKDKNSSKKWYNWSMAAFIVGLIAVMVWLAWFFGLRNTEHGELMYKISMGLNMIAIVLCFIANAMIVNVANNVDKEIVHVDDRKLIKDMKNWGILNLTGLSAAFLSGIVALFAHYKSSDAPQAASATKFYYF